MSERPRKDQCTVGRKSPERPNGWCYHAALEAVSTISVPITSPLGKLLSLSFDCFQTKRISLCERKVNTWLHGLSGKPISQNGKLTREIRRDLLAVLLTSGAGQQVETGAIVSQGKGDLFGHQFEARRVPARNSSLDRTVRDVCG
jgi:hypothetical protein